MKEFSIGCYDEGHLISSFIHEVIKQFPHVTIRFNTRSKDSLFKSLENLLPDVLFMNLVVKNKINYVLVTKIKTQFSNLKIVGFVYGIELSQHAVFRLINSGIVAIVTDAHSPDEMILTLKTVTEKGFHVNEVMNEAMISYCKRKKLLRHSFGPDEKFTERELIIIEEKRIGKTSQEIADQLFLSKKSVDGALQNLYSRFECRNFNELVLKYDFHFSPGESK